jgi:hypothetical protein
MVARKRGEGKGREKEREKEKERERERERERESGAITMLVPPNPLSSECIEGLIHS